MVTERLKVRVGSDDVPKVTVVSVVDAPRTTKLVDIEALSSASPDDVAYQDAVAPTVGGWWLNGTPFSVTVPLDRVPRPRPQLDAERAVTTVEASDWIRGFEDGRPLGDWLVDADGHRVTFRLPFDPAAAMDAGSAAAVVVLRVAVELEDATLHAASLVPRSYRAGDPTVWEFRLRPRDGATGAADAFRDAHGARVSEFWLTVRPQGTTAWFLRTSHGAWWWLVQPLANVLAWLAGLLVLLRVRQRWKAAPDWSGDGARCVWAVIAAGLAIAAVACFEQYRATVFGAFPRWAEWALMVEVALPLAVAATLALPSRARPITVPATIVLAVAIGYLAEVPGGNPLGVSAVIRAMACAAAILFTVIGSTIAVTRTWLGWPGGGRWTLGLAALAATVLLGWAAWWVLRGAADARALWNLGFVDAYGNAAGTPADGIVQTALGFSGWFTDAILGWLPFIAVPLAFSALRWEALGDHDAVPPRHAGFLVVALYGVFVAGPWGAILWISVALTLLVSLAFLWPLVKQGYKRQENPSARRQRFSERLVPRLPRLPHAGEAEAQQDVLSAGPTGSWWHNGAHAARIGAVVALPFALHYLVLWFRANANGLSPVSNPVGALWGANAVAFEYMFWLTAAFAFGALYRLLPGRIGVFKGAVLAAIFAVAQAVCELLPGTFDVMSWPTIVAEVVLYYAIVGAIFDRDTVRRSDRAQDGLLKVYGFNSNTEAILGALPFAGTIALLLVQQLISGDASNAIGDVLQAVPMGPTSASR